MQDGILFFAAAALTGLVGVAMLACAVFADRSRGRRRCPKCWYDMSATELRRCSECGYEAKFEKKLFKTRRRWKWAMASLILFAAAGFIAIQPKVKKDGWESLVPNTVLILSLRLRDNSWAFAELRRRLMIDVSNVNSTATGFDVPDSSAFFDWQWSMIADVCVDQLDHNPQPLDQAALLEWMAFAVDDLNEIDSTRIHRRMALLLADESAFIRERAALYCASWRHPEYSVEVIRPLLNDENQRVRFGAVTGLRLLSHHSQAPVEALFEAIHHDDWEVRRFAAAAIGSMARYGTPPANGYEILVESYGLDNRVEVRAQALEALCRFESRLYDAMPILRESLTSEEPAIRAAALHQLASMQTFDKALEIESAIRGIQDKDSDVRMAASWLLRNRIPWEAMTSHVEMLQALADDPKEHDNVREAAWYHLNQIYGHAN